MSGVAGIAVESLVVDHHTAAGVVRALNGLTFQVPSGSSLAVVGPSGCGKSTLLGLIGGLDVPTSGTVHVDGRSISSLRDRERATYRRHHVGFVYQADNLLPFLTVAENVSLQLALQEGRARARDEERRRTIDLLSRLGLEDKADRLPDQLSGGQRQRVAVARAIVHQPTVILADEPTGALDPVSAARVVELLLRVQAELEATLVIVTHDSTVAARLDRRIALRDGAMSSRTRRRHAH